MSQDYTTRANDVYVIIGNSVLMKCEIPSFVADFVYIFSWVNSEGEEIFSSNSAHGISIITLEKKVVGDTQAKSQRKI